MKCEWYPRKFCSSFVSFFQITCFSVSVIQHDERSLEQIVFCLLQYSCRTGSGGSGVQLRQPRGAPFVSRSKSSPPLSGIGCNMPRRLFLGPGVPVTAPHLSPGCWHQCPGWKGPHWLDRQAPERTSVWPSGAWTHSRILPSTQTGYLSQSVCTEAWRHQQTPSRTGGNMSRAQGMLVLALRRHGDGQSRTAAIFAGSVETPSQLTMWPRKFTSRWNSWHFLGLSFRPAARSLVRTARNLSSWSWKDLAWTITSSK